MKICKWQKICLSISLLRVDVLLEDVRDERKAAAAHDGVDGEPEYVRDIVRQRAALMDVAAMLADVRLEWSDEPQRQRKA
jgi:hypothetical protein